MKNYQVRKDNGIFSSVFFIASRKFDKSDYQVNSLMEIIGGLSKNIIAILCIGIVLDLAKIARRYFPAFLWLVVSSSLWSKKIITCSNQPHINRGTFLCAVSCAAENFSNVGFGGLGAIRALAGIYC